jgi:hypothetical protein
MKKLNVKFYIVESKSREVSVADAFGRGVTHAGDNFSIANASDYESPLDNIQVACAFALKGNAKRILTGYREAGVRTILVDKGLIRASTGMGASKDGYYRVSLDEFMPLDRIERMMADPSVTIDRWNETRMKTRKHKPNDGPIVYCGSSQKYCDFHDLGDEHEYAVAICNKIRAVVGPDVRIIYRPKPSYTKATQIPGCEFSQKPYTDETLGDLINQGISALVTHGSHAGIDAILGGVPVIALGPTAARPVAQTSIDDLLNLQYQDRHKVERWLAALAYWQWKPDEMNDSRAWRFLKAEMGK